MFVALSPFDVSLSSATLLLPHSSLLCSPRGPYLPSSSWIDSMPPFHTYTSSPINLSSLSSTMDSLFDFWTFGSSKGSSLLHICSFVPVPPPSLSHILRKRDISLTFNQFAKQ
uniref:Uncharacterized protein n=1 Tax=Bionectria ochroleuca TaxID=29856 RepID=A0A8H7N909_BIOOC